MQGGACSRVQDEGHEIYELLSGYGGLVGGWESFPQEGEYSHDII